MQAWSQFAKELTDFKLEENRTQAMHCLNLLITNALHHIPDVLKYMSRIRSQSVFNFCAIPQVHIIHCIYILCNALIINFVDCEAKITSRV